MGLDMYLDGEKFIPTNWREPEKNIMEDGFMLQKKTLRLGYWRKHPDLHGYIVQTFAEGVDECQDIELSGKDILKILDAIKEENLPETTGFFFGKSLPEDRQPTIEIFEKALKWLNEDDGTWKSIIYHASW